MFYFFLRATGSRERLRKNRIDELLEKEGKPIVVSKLRSWIRALGTWSEGVETESERGKYKAIWPLCHYVLKYLLNIGIEVGRTLFSSFLLPDFQSSLKQFSCVAKVGSHYTGAFLYEVGSLDQHPWEHLGDMVYWASLHKLKTADCAHLFPTIYLLTSC